MSVRADEQAGPEEEDRPGDGTSRAVRRPTPDRRVWIFPVLVLACVAILTGLGWSGTSAGVAQPHNSHLIAGTPRPIRSDEWNVATPLIVAQSHHGYPATTPDSIGSHSLNVLLDVPTRTWATLFRPWDWGIFGLGVVPAFAFRWWMLSAVLLLGSYALLWQLTRRAAASALFSVALWASPFFHWWYLDLSFASAGMGLAALAAFLAALDAPSGLRKALLLVVSAWALVSFGLVLYPPFQVPVALVVILVGAGHLWGRHRSVGAAVRATVVPLVGVVGATLAVLGAYYLANRTAIQLIYNTVYPGRRRDTGGVTALYQFFSAPYGLELARHGANLSGENQSEISSFIIVGPYICLQLLRVRMRGLGRLRRNQLIGALVAMALLLAWYFIGLPGPLATVTALDRVPATRAIGGIGLSSLLVAALLSLGLSESTTPLRTTGRHSRRQVPLLAPDLLAGALVAAGLAFGVTFWSGRMLDATFPALAIGTHTALASGLAVAVIVFLLSAGRPLLGGGALAAMGLVVALPANPLYSGLAPYTSPSVTRVLTSVPGAHDAGWVSFAGPPLSTELVATGLRTVNAVSLYPDPAAWRILDPTGSQRRIWDRYANLDFRAAPGQPAATLQLLQQDTVVITLDPCGSQLRRLGVRFVLSPQPLTEGCLTQVRQARLLGSQVYIYKTPGS